MKKGNLIGNGMTAEVYEWEKDKVLKLYFKRFTDEWVNYEAKIGTIVHEAGVPSPEVFEIIDFEDRKGIIFQRIFGNSMLKHIAEEPWNINYYTHQLVALQFKIHQFTAECLPSQKERFAVKINNSTDIPKGKVSTIMDYIEKLPDGNNVCHGDLHYNNIIISKDELIPIDWTNAYKGNPLSDVARTCLMITSPTNYRGVSEIMMNTLQFMKMVTYWSYINEYMRLAHVRFEDIDEWILPVAAAKLKDKIPGEEKWLIKIINKRLEQFD